MAATNLLFVHRDGVFDCFDKITAGYIKKEYKYYGFKYPAIDETLQSNTILVVASHGSPNGILESENSRVNATTFVERCIIPKITYKDRISKVVYLVCSSGQTIGNSSAFNQLAPNKTLNLGSGSDKKLYVEGEDSKKINDILKFEQDQHGWLYRAKVLE